jgi:phosphoribosylamine--glycine ligase
MDYLNSVLIIGSGAREHAMVKALLRCDRPLCMFAYPGNPGMESDGCTIITSPINDWTDLAEWALLNEIDLTIVGPEIPLVDGITDIFKKRNLKIFGPSQKASQLEGSKIFAKKIMEKYGIPTASFKTFSDIETARLYVKQQAAPVVVKANGLAAGKGVYVCETADEACIALSDVFEKKIFGEAGTTVVIEEKMEGEEASVFVLTDGNTYKILPVSQDHKRALDNDKGPNTGGMGAYAPCLLVDTAMAGRIEKEIISPTLAGMKKEGIPYSGLLYIGIMVTSSGPKVVEFNCRFGDPEAQAVLPLVECDWFEAFKACATGSGELSSLHMSIKKGFSVAVSLTSKGYPGKYEKDKLITGIESTEKKYVNVDVYHAGTKINENGKLVTNGGRVLTVNAVSETLKGAIASAYEAVEKIKFEGKTYRSDIAAKGLLKIKK